MSEQKRTWRPGRLAYICVIAGWILYAGLSIFTPSPATAHYHISAPALFLLELTILIPILLIWLMAAHGAVAFKNYALMIRGGRESEGLNLVADGLLWTIAYLVFTTVARALSPFLTPSHISDVIIVIRGNIAPLVSLVAFTLIYLGSHRMRNIANFATWTRGTAWITPLYGVFAFLFVLEFVANPAGAEPVASRTVTSIVGPEVSLFTLIIPMLAAWFIGIVAAINITKYAREVKGIIYRQALRDLARGLLAVILFSIVLQLTSFAARYFAGLSLGAVLAIIYPLIILYGLGFVFVRTGARKLTRIESMTS